MTRARRSIIDRLAGSAGIQGWIVASVLLFVLLALWAGTWPWREPAGAALLMVWGFGFVTSLGLRLLEILFSFEIASLAVARVVILEAVRRRVVLVTMGLLLFLLVAIAFNLQGDHLLYLRLPAVLTYSLELTAVMLSMLTVFLSCSTLATEVEEKRVYSTLTKPISRRTFVLGKWIGIVGLNGVLLAVVCGTVYATATLQWAQAKSPGEAQRVAREVLTARLPVIPEPVGLEERIEAAWQEETRRLESDDPALFRRLRDNPRAWDMQYESIQAQQLTWWLQVAPGQEETYRFRGLPTGSDALLHLNVQMRFSDRRPASDRDHWFWITLDGESREFPLIHNNPEYIAVPQAALDDGDLVVKIRCDDPDSPTLILTSEHGIELLFVQGTFWQNLVRALLIQWIKLSFIAALGLCAASFLSFPVATLAVVIIGGVSASADFVLEEGHSGHRHESVSERADVQLIEGFVDFVEASGKSVAQLLAQFSAYAPVEPLAAGRLVSWSSVGSCFLWIGVVWSGVCLLIGVFLFGRRELARVQV